MFMPLMVDLKRVILFGGERGEGRQKCEKLACYADELLVVPERPFPQEEIVLDAGPLPHVAERLELSEARRIPVAAEPASSSSIGRFISGATFVVSDLSDRALNEQIASTCRERGILCNVIDTKDLCSVWFMSLIDTPHLVAAISSKGGCAYFAKQTRIELEPEIARREPVAAILTEARALVPKGVDRTAVLDAIYRDAVFNHMVTAGEWTEARARAATIREAASGATPSGRQADAGLAEERRWQESSTI